MRSAWIIVACLLPLSLLRGEVDVEPVPTDGKVVLRPGINAVAITRFPALGQDGVLGESFTLPFVFGAANEAGLASGNADTADLVWIHIGQGRWARFYYGKAVTPTGESEAAWRNVASQGRDVSGFSWPYTEGMLIERRSDEPLSIAIKGLVKRTNSVLKVQTGTQYFNRVLDGPLTLAELRLEEFFVRAPEDLIFEMVVDNPGNPSPGPMGARLPADQFLEPVSGASYVLSEKGIWYLLGSRKSVDPEIFLVPGTFGIERVGEAAELVLQAPNVPVVTPVVLRDQPFLGLGEGAVRQLRVDGLGPPECSCAFLLHDNRPISLHVIESHRGSAIVRVGKHPDDVITDRLAIASGRGVIASLKPASDFFGIERTVRSFAANGPTVDPRPFVVKLPNPELREEEQRFFSDLDPEGRLVLALDQAEWQAQSLLEIDLIALTPDNLKIALHLPRVRLHENAGADVFARELAQLLRLALIERELVPSDQLRIQVGAQPDGATLTLNFGEPLRLGKVDVCVVPPLTRPTIERTDNFAFDGAIIEVIGKDFGRRIDDLCLVLAPIDGVGSSIPLRPMSLSPDGTRILARVVGPISDGRDRRVMMARGVGRTRPIHLGFDDVIVRQGVWVWRGTGAEPTISPSVVRAALAQGETMHFQGNLEDGSLGLTIDQAWPENGEVSISFTASTASVQLDAYAPELCFSVSGSAEECGERLQRVIEAAFVQGGMANGNQVQVEMNVNGDEVSLTANVFTEDGVRDPITSGHLNVSVSEGDHPCEPPAPDDADGDLMQDEWETDTFDMPPPLVDALADPDSDDFANHVEFAFALNPLVMNDMTPLAISLDDDNHPLITYRRHVAAPNFYNFDIETSMDGSHWERLANLETLSIVPVGLGLPIETIVERCVVDTQTLPGSFYRLRLTPRS